MIDFQTQMDRAVSEFVAQVTDLARRAALNSLESALGRNTILRGRSRRTASGGRRSPDDLDRLRDQFVSFVAKHPGLRIEQINKELGTKTRELALPIRKLIADGTIKTKGKKRSTTYFAK
jgi:hypothetical protein